ncbi:hypothetical protein THIOM_003087 [Candidatus Thiomargarita nelsonii]|uniref:Uncharacterized protein n=1 Tax=Candidatus Thiomargarita nelsonii TaxID=1003181 RepID=A0A176RZD1_9GAMM|nr:hypothetical protein THIOM_003087 [Candidatus Thiomargarita nelsonii]
MFEKFMIPYFIRFVDAILCNIFSEFFKSIDVCDVLLYIFRIRLYAKNEYSFLQIIRNLIYYIIQPFFILIEINNQKHHSVLIFVHSRNMIVLEGFQNFRPTSRRR